ncbi:TonB-dependent receptor domain-containing protein [Frateuria aurantia]
MKKHPMALAIVLGLALGLPAVHAQSSTTTTSTQTASGSDQSSPDASKTAATKTKARSLDQVQVTGSLINSAQIQTATPSYTISAQEIQARGFNSVAEVLQQSVFASGTTQGPQTSGGFTQGAQTVSMYGLNPEYTLTLIDGKPITQFGQLYNGASNFTNVSNIPISMIDHIDIIPGGGSSIYGSAAIAGTINIVTKQHMDGGEVYVRTGNFHNGGGANQRFGGAFGKTIGKFSVLGSFEFDNASPMWAYQSSYIRNKLNTQENPTTVAAAINYGTLDQYTGSVLGYISPGDDCAGVSDLYGGTTTAASRTGRTGTYCGSRQVLGQTTLNNKSQSYDGMLKLRYDVNDHVRIYSDVLADFQKQSYTPGSDYTWWDSYNDLGFLEDQNKNIVNLERVFAPEEMLGGYGGQLDRQDDLMYQADIGANGTFGDSNWNWDAYFMRSGDHTTTSSPSFLASAIDGWFEKNVLGTSTGIDPESGLAMYNINYANFYKGMTPSEFASTRINVPGESNTWVNNGRVTLSNDALFHLPGGDAGFAWLIEGGSQAWYEPISPLISNGDIWGLTGDSGGGTRSHAASAFELNLPLFKQLTVDLSGRYDHYSIPGGDTNSKFTWKAGLEYRPFDTLLLRANYATAFLAPDMSSLYLGPSGTYDYVTDYYECAQAGAKNCQNYQEEVETSQNANKNLKPTTATDWTAGFVYSPVPDLSISVDYLHIQIRNEVIVQDANLLTREESQCRTGELDASSPTCVAALSQVQRSTNADGSLGDISKITTYYENLANEDTDSVTSEVKYHFPTTPIGDFSVQLDYMDMLKHQYQEYAGEAPINMLTNPLWSTEFKSIASGDVTWSLHHRWTSTLFWHRYGATPNYIAYYEGTYDYPGAGKVAPYITFNWSLGFSPTKNLDLTLMVNNLMNKMPKDASWDAFPYYNSANYNPYGREIMLQADYSFSLGGGH